MVVVLPVPLTPTMSTTAGPPSTDGRGVQSTSRGDEQRGELGADGRLGTAGVAPAARPLDDVDGQRRADVAGDERLLDVVPGRAAGFAEEAAELRHEAAAGPLEAGVERRRGRGLGERESGRTARRRARARAVGSGGAGVGSPAAAGSGSACGSGPGGRRLERLGGS